MLAREASGDEFLAMRLAHDKILGVNDCYINARLTELRGEPFTILSSETYQTAIDVGKSGGDGGESNSPSRKGYPESTTGLVSSLILPVSPLLTEFSQASQFFFHRPYRRPGDGTPTFRHPNPDPSG